MVGAAAAAGIIGTSPAAAQTATHRDHDNGPLGARLRVVQHFAVTVQNMDRAFEFYTEVRGGTEVMRDGDFKGEPIHYALMAR